jgi:hypothetical protein
VQDFEGAAKIYDALLAKQPGNRVVVYNATMLYQKYTKNFDKAKKVLEDYQKAAGTLSPNDEYFQWVTSVDKDREIERKRKEELKRIEDEKKEREERQKKQLKDMEDKVTKMEADLKDACLAATDAGMMATMVIEQAKPVITEKDLAMVGDMESFVNQSVAELEAAKAGCTAAAPAPAAPEAPAPAPAPAEPAPAPAPPG